MNLPNQQQSIWKCANKKGLNRRRMLQSLGTSAMAATVGVALNERLELWANGPVQSEVVGLTHAVAVRAQPFDLSEVRLLDGPFRHAQQRDAEYLLQLEPNRMLHNFRVNAGLDPKAPVYGGWESVPMW